MSTKKKDKKRKKKKLSNKNRREARKLLKSKQQATSSIKNSPKSEMVRAINGDVESERQRDEVIVGAPIVEAYDEYLLERSRTQWQFGDWDSLAKLDRSMFEYHLDRTKLALLAAAARLQTDRVNEAKLYINLAKEWGATNKLISQVLIAGTYDSLGKLSIFTGQQERALQYFSHSVNIGTPGADVQLLGEARRGRQMSFLANNSQNQQIVAEAQKKKPVDISVGQSALFTVSVHQKNAPVSVVDLGFYTNNDKWIKREKEWVHYDVPKGSHLYLVSSECGDFNKPPTTNWLDMEPDNLYQISVNFPRQASEPAFFWIFEYDREDKRNNSKSTLCSTSSFTTFFNTSKDSSMTYGLGIRLAGEGSFDLESIRIELTSGLDAKIADQEERIDKLQNDIKNASKATLKQLEDFSRIQHYLGPEITLPPMHGWPISPDFGLLLIEQVENHDYDALIELGSGTSTLLIARILQKQTANTIFLSLDHLEQYFEATQTLLKRADLDTLVDLQLAPLSPYRDESGDEYLYYQCADTLSKLASDLSTNPKLLVVVDGPPSATGRHARYPALPLLLRYFPSAQIDILMDDYIRDDEQQIVGRWQELLDVHEKSVVKMEFKQLEKQACLLHVRTK